MTTEKKYQQLETQIQPFKFVLKKAADAVLDQDVSNYPILVLHKQEIELGISIINEIESSDDWMVSVSTLEEFMTKQIVEISRVNHFKKIYKPADEFLCLFVMDEFGATFVFLPRS